MRIAHGKTMEFGKAALRHRSGDVAFKTFFTGTEGTLENFLFTLARQGRFYSPPHRHNFEQFRYAYRGDFSIAPNLTLREGELGYFPEGTPYGPQDDGEGERMLLVLQFGGPSGQGYLSQAQLDRAYETLSKRGRFEKGKYLADEGDAAPKDGFEAIWQFHNGRALDYPTGRYKAPIVMRPDHFHWRPVAGSPGALTKTLGVFSERLTRAEMVRLRNGATLPIGAEQAIRLLFVIAGEGRLGDEPCQQETALELSPGEGIDLIGGCEMDLLMLSLPMLETPEAAG